MQWNLQYVKVLFLTLLKVVGARGIEPLQAAKEEHLWIERSAKQMRRRFESAHRSQL